MTAISSTLTRRADTSVHVVINDQGNTGGTPVPGLEGFADITIDVNAPPVFGNVGPGVTYTELAAPVLIDFDLTLDDPDGTTIDHASVRITTGGLVTDRLMINGLRTSDGDPIAGTNISFNLRRILLARSRSPGPTRRRTIRLCWIW